MKRLSDFSVSLVKKDLLFSTSGSKFYALENTFHVGIVYFNTKR